MWITSHMPPTGDLAHNPGMCPDWGSNQRPFALEAGAQSTEPHQPGLRHISICLLVICLSSFVKNLFNFIALFKILFYSCLFYYSCPPPSHPIFHSYSPSPPSCPCPWVTHTCLCTPMFTAVPFTTAKCWKQPSAHQ